MKTFFILLLASSIFLCEAWNQDNPIPSCLRSGITWDQSDIIATKIDIATSEDCQNSCSQMDSCACFTWLSEESSIFSRGCLMFSEVAEELSCDECISGKPKCLCTVHGECKEQDMNMIQVPKKRMIEFQKASQNTL